MSLKLYQVVIGWASGQLPLQVLHGHCHHWSSALLNIPFELICFPASFERPGGGLAMASASFCCFEGTLHLSRNMIMCQKKITLLADNTDARSGECEWTRTSGYPRVFRRFASQMSVVTVILVTDIQLTSRFPAANIAHNGITKWNIR